MKVLVALAAADGEVVSRESLISVCWGGRIVSPDAVHRCMSQLRRLGEASGAFAVVAIPRVGYRLIKAPPTEPAAQPLSPEPAGRSRSRPSTPRVLLWLAASGVAALTAAIGLGALVESRRSEVPRAITWTYDLGKRDDAPNGLRFWTSEDGEVWRESFADGRVRSRFYLVSSYRWPGGCAGALLRRQDRTLIAFVPDRRCSDRRLVAEDIDPQSGAVTRRWFTLGSIEATSFAGGDPPHP